MGLDDFKYKFYQKWGLENYIKLFNEKPPVRFARPLNFNTHKTDYDQK